MKPVAAPRFEIDMDISDGDDSRPYCEKLNCPVCAYAEVIYTHLDESHCICLTCCVFDIDA